MDFKSYFEIPSDIAYLNTPGNGLLPRSHYDWRMKREQDFFDIRGDLRDKQGDFIAQVKSGLARLFNCEKGIVYAVPNFSFGFNAVLNGLPKEFSFLLLDEEYPSLHYPIQSHGFQSNKVEWSDAIESSIEAAIRKHKPDALAISLVNYISGLKIDLEFIKQLKTTFPDLIIIGDATQYLGTEPFDFDQSGFDVLAGSGYKWMMAGFGNGYLMLSPRMKAILYQEAQKLDRPQEAMWRGKSILDTFFEPGHQDTLAHGTLLESVRFLEKVGLENVKAYIANLAGYTYDALDERGLLLPEIKNRKVKSSLINIQLDPTFYEVLMNHGVKCFPRGSGIRIGIHLYNDKNDINRLLEIIDNK